MRKRVLISKKINLDNVPLFINKKHADYIFIGNNGTIIVVEETDRVKSKDIRQLKETIELILRDDLIKEWLRDELKRNRIRSEREEIEENLKGGIIHFKRIGTHENKLIGELVRRMSKIKVKVFKANCYEQLNKRLFEIIAYDIRNDGEIKRSCRFAM